MAFATKNTNDQFSAADYNAIAAAVDSKAQQTGNADITITDAAKGFVLTTPTGEKVRITAYKDSNGQPQLNITLF